MIKMYISVHEHCRDWNQNKIATIKDTMDLARRYNFAAIADMPNTDPPIDTVEHAHRRLRLARDEGVNDGYYFHMGISTNPQQIKEAVRAVKEISECVGIKMYTCESTNIPGIKTEKEQLLVYKELVNNDYHEVLTVHCEKEVLFQRDKWDPKRPYTWNEVRPEEAEEAAVRDQITFLQKSEAKFSLHIAHVSSPKTLGVIKDAKKNGVRISYGMTPHHLILSTKVLRHKNGIRYKVNPPLRDEDSVKRLRGLVSELSSIGLIETDHAPHNKLKKRGIDCEMAPSGVQSLYLYPLLIRKMSEWGIDESKINKLTCENAKKFFLKILA